MPNARTNCGSGGITYIRTFTGWVYAAFIIDVYSRMVVGWQVSKNLYSDLALDALNMAIWQRTPAGDDLEGLIHHSDRGVQYRALHYTERLEEQDLAASVGPAAIPTTTPWPRRSTRCSKPN